MLSRFNGTDGQRLLVDAVRSQALVRGDDAVARALVDALTLLEIAPGAALISQGGTDNDLYLIVAGVVEIRINGRVLATRKAGQHVGELSLIDPTTTRSATVTASEPTLVGRISEPSFAKIAEKHPALWRALAIDIGDRLRQRTRFVAPPNDRPAVFIGSSSEALPVAEHLRSELTCPELTVRLWTDGIFTASNFLMEDLERELAVSDFAILVVAPDDIVTSRGISSGAPRDNVVFELGLFMGALSRPRTFMLVPKGAEVKLPSDLVGLNQLRYALTSPKADIDALIGELKAKVLAQGPR
jgi:CRP/FNR family transcriptional regulator, cyclic AMP receptor protein